MAGKRFMEGANRKESHSDENDNIIIIGTRGSALALAQTKIVLNLLKRKNRDKKLRFQIRTIKTEGDTDLYRKRSTGTGKELFTRTIDRALVAGEIDVAVHSLKDVPVEGSYSSKIEIGAFPKRESPYDVLITKKKGDTLSTLPKNARIGTSSARRAVQLRSFRPDLEIIEIHGNVQTRIKKLKSSNLDAIVLAMAGLKRLKLAFRIGKRLPKSLMLPAAGQGCLAVAIRKGDHRTRSIVSEIDDKHTRLAVNAERAFSRELGGGCNLPIAALATLSRNSPRKLVLDGLVELSSPNGGGVRVARSRTSGRAEEAESLGKTSALKLKRIVGNDRRMCK